MKFEFPSIVNTEKYIFVYDSDRYESAPVSPHFYVKEMMGGNFHYCDPLPVKLVSEYLGSLAEAMINNDDMCYRLRCFINRGPTAEAIQFASSVVYKDSKKTKYFSKELQRTSAVSSKRFDRRWESIAPYMDGSPESMMSVLTIDYARDGFTKFIFADAIYNWIQSDRKRYRKMSMSRPSMFVKWTDNFHEAYTIDSAWKACLLAIQIWEAKKNFKDRIDNFKQYAMVSKLEQ